jgi:hypothetical protein
MSLGTNLLSFYKRLFLVVCTTLCRLENLCTLIKQSSFFKLKTII